MQSLRVFAKNTLIFLFSATICGVMAQPSFADQSAKPTLISFTLSQDSVDMTSGNLKITVDLVVTNPTGISSQQTRLTVTDGGVNTATAQLVRTDITPNSPLQTVKFEGVLDVSSLAAGAYIVSAAPITSLNANGSSGYSTDTLYPTTSATVVGAKNYLLIRNNGNLNFSYPTFKGPAFNKASSTVYADPKYTLATLPIWAVGETFNPSDYYELTVPIFSLKVRSITPLTCTSNGISLSLVATGACAFEVYTDKTNDYQYFKDAQTVTILPARTKPTYVVSPVPTQSSAILPLSISGPGVFGVSGYIIPVSITPSVCYAVGTYINILSGGTCTLNYSTPGTSTYLPSDVYPLTFQITRTAQSVTFSLPATVAQTVKTFALTATASSGLPITFHSTTPKICSITGNSLIPLSLGACGVSADQIGSATITPASATQTIVVTGEVAKKFSSKAVICVKNGKSKSITGSKCPKGYKATK